MGTDPAGSSAPPTNGLRGGRAAAVAAGGSAWGSPDPPAPAAPASAAAATEGFTSMDGVGPSASLTPAATPPSAAVNGGGATKVAWGKAANGGSSSASATPPLPPPAIATASPDTIARAVHLAREDDAEKLEAIRTNKADDSTTKTFSHYVIPKRWMARLLRYLNDTDGDGNCDRPERIVNRDLLDTKHEEAKEEEKKKKEEEESREERKARWAAKVAGPAPAPAPAPVANSGPSAASPRILKPESYFGMDYTLVGPAVWDLLSTKFGYDVSIPCRLEVGKKAWGRPSTLSVVVPIALDDGDDGLYGDAAVKENSKVVDGVKHALIDVPESGKWRYGGMDDRVSKKAREEEEASAPTTPKGDAKMNDANPADEIPDSEATMADSNAIIPLGPPTASIAAAAAEAARQRSGGSAVANPIQVEDETANWTNDSSMVDATAEAAVTATVVATATKKRRHATGLGNLGNTCFMNSTLQCLAHTAPLRQYFVYGNYQADLNRDNPLGTGGNLTTEFAKLLKEMWGISGGDSASSNGSSSGGLYSGGGSTYFSRSYNNSAVYPRQFKTTLGQYASQFVGYDQHDSHELAAYLLDSLHEDTNRILKKPFVEKPEKKDDETDDQAALRAWEAHLQRENSRIVEIFFGQFKTRVQCPHAQCGKVSTTYDPCMYLPVPIPGASDRTIEVTFVPLDPRKRRTKLSVTVSRTANIEGLRAKIVETVNKIYAESGDSTAGTIHDDDVRLADMWHHKVWSWFDDLNKCVDEIKESDATFAYELRPVAEIHEETDAVLEAAMEASDDADVVDAQELPAEASARKVKGDKWQRYDIDSDATIMEKLNEKENAWVDMLLNSYVKNNYTYYRWFDGREEPDVEKVIPFYEQMLKTIKKLERCSDSVVAVGPGTSTTPSAMDEDPVDPAAESEIREISDADFDDALEQDDDEISINEDGQPLADRLDMDTLSKFQKIHTAQDFAIFVRCAQRLREWIIAQQKKEKEKEQQEKEKKKDGITIQIQLVKKGAGVSMSEDPFTTPLLLRISSVLTVTGLRELLAEQLSRGLKLEVPTSNEEAKEEGASPDAVMTVTDDDPRASGLLTSPTDANGPSAASPNVIKAEVGEEKSLNGKPSKTTPLDILQQIPLTYGKSSRSGYSATSSSSYRKLGALMRQQSGHITTESNVSASPSDPDESETIADVVGDKDIVYLHWPAGLSQEYFDQGEWEKVDDMPGTGSPKKKADAVTLMDCIAKHCEREQLEESEAWYCSSCKEHVRGFKEERIYKAPPILVVNLKRFIFSPTTHRRNKIDTFIDFPIEGLDLSQFVMSWKEGEEPIYDLYAVSNHFGGLGGGHYTAYAKDDDGKWCNFDDSRVTENVNESDIVSPAAYCLYYKRRDIPNVDDSAEVAVEADVIATVKEEPSTGMAIASPFEPADGFMKIDMDVVSTGSNRTAASNEAMASVGSQPPALLDGDPLDDFFGDGEFNGVDQQDSADMDAEANAYSSSHFGPLQ